MKTSKNHSNIPIWLLTTVQVYKASQSVVDNGIQSHITIKM